MHRVRLESSSRAVLASANYWSSSEFSSNTTNAWNQNFNNGNQNNNNKSNSNYARAIRKQMSLDIEPKDLFHAYFDCRKGKRNTHNAAAFEESLERNLMELYRELVSGEYSPGRSICFAVGKPKLREIWAADFRDRVVQTLFYNRYRDAFHKTFIFDSYACIPGKGTLRAGQRLEKFVCGATHGHTREAWFLKADVANFFVGIDKTILFDILKKKITEDSWRDLCSRILFNDVKKGVLVKGNKKLLASVPKRKSLYHADDNFGLPVGNLTSQFFANIYLNELDQFVKHELRQKYYVRYVDDLIILGENPQELNKCYELIDEFLQERLNLHLHSNKKEINRVHVGINFVGYVVKPHRTYIRRMTTSNLNCKLEGILQKKRASLHDIAVINSYLGLLRQVSGYNKRKAVAMRLKSLGVELDAALTKVVSTPHNRR